MQSPIKGYQFTKFNGRRTLILGNHSSDKNRILCKILADGVARRYRGISVIDMAPRGNLDSEESVPISIGAGHARLLFPRRVYEPRAEGSDRREINQLAIWNASNIGAELRKFISRPTRALFINEITMYLHKGPLALLLKAISKSSCFVGSGFRGTISLDDFETGITRREKKLVDRLARYMDEVISL